MAIDVERGPAGAGGPHPAPAAGDGAVDDVLARRAKAVAILVPLVIIAAAGVLRFYKLGTPERCYFDETYYYYDARDYLDMAVERDFAVHPPVGKWMIAVGLAVFGVPEGSPIDQAVVDDPGGCGGDEENLPARAREEAESFARRFSSAVVGTASVWFAYLAGLRLFRRRGAAALGALLLAVDGLALTMSRISMLDIFLSFWVLLGFWLLLVDRDRLWANAARRPAAPGPDEHSAPAGQSALELPATGEAATSEAATSEAATSEAATGEAATGEAATGEAATGGEPAAGVPQEPADDQRPARHLPPRSRLFLWLAGVAFGLAVATKWSALLAIGAAGLFVLGSEFAWRKRLTERFIVKPHLALARTFLALVTVPALVYIASYAPYFANYEHTRPAGRDCPEAGCPADALPSQVARMASGWWEEQGEILHFHSTLDVDHPYRASPATWLLLQRPVAYYYESCNEQRAERGEDCAVAPGNVAEILGIGNPAIWWLALPAYLLLLWDAIWRRRWAAVAIGLFLALQYGVWLLIGRPAFLFYMTPAVPFIALAVAYAAARIGERRGLRWLPATVGVLAVAGLLFWLPILVGMEIPKTAWDLRIWMRSWI